jgi:hypothetical protein
MQVPLDAWLLTPTRIYVLQCCRVATVAYLPNSPVSPHHPVDTVTAFVIPLLVSLSFGPQADRPQGEDDGSTRSTFPPSISDC